MNVTAVAGTVLALASAASGRTIVERVHTTPTRRAANGCAFLISAPLVGGGTQTTCVTGVDSVPGSGVVMHSEALMTFRLERGTIRARVEITQRFGSDGVHARQTLRGSIVGGTRTYRGARGSITGSGTVTDRASGLGPVDLRYALHLASSSTHGAEPNDADHRTSA